MKYRTVLVSTSLPHDASITRFGSIQNRFSADDFTVSVETKAPVIYEDVDHKKIMKVGNFKTSVNIESWLTRMYV